MCEHESLKTISNTTKDELRQDIASQQSMNSTIGCVDPTFMAETNLTLELMLRDMVPNPVSRYLKVRPCAQTIILA